MITLKTYHGREYLNNELGNGKILELQSKLNSTRKYQDFTFIKKSDSTLQVIGKIALAVITLTASLWISLLADHITKNLRIEKIRSFESDLKKQLDATTDRILGDYKRCTLNIDGKNVSEIEKQVFINDTLNPLIEDLKERFGPVKTLQVLDGITQTSANSTALCNTLKIESILNPEGSLEKKFLFTGSTGFKLNLDPKEGRISGSIDGNFSTAPSKDREQIKIPVSISYTYDLNKLEGVSKIKLDSTEFNDSIEKHWNFYFSPLPTRKLH